MACTDAGVAIKSTNKGINVKAGTKASDTPRRQIYGRTKVGGFWIYAETTGTTNEYLHMVIGLCDGPIEEIEAIYLGDELLTLDGSGNGTGKWAGAVVCKKHLGASDQTADADLVAASAGKWTANHRLRGVAYIYLRLDNWDGTAQTPSPAVFGGVPNISAIIKGRNDITDPRTGLTGYSDNAALCFAHYRSVNNALPIDSASIIAAANKCDELTAGRKRFTVGGMIESTASVDDVTRQFLVSMTGTLTATANGLFLRVGAPPLPSFRLTWDKLLTNPKTQRVSGTGDTFTAAAATESTNWQQTDATSQTDAKSTLKLDLVNSDEQAQQLAAVENKKNGPTEKINCQVGISALDLVAGDAVDVDLYPMAYGRFEVVSATVNLELVPSVDLVLERQRTGLYDDITTTAPTVNAIAITPRSLSAPSLSLPAGSYATAAWPLGVQVTAGNAATVRYSFSTMPLVVTDGSDYFGAVNVPVIGVGNTVTLYVAVFKTGWTSASTSAAYTQT